MEKTKLSEIVKVEESDTNEGFEVNDTPAITKDEYFASFKDYVVILIGNAGPKGDAIYHMNGISARDLKGAIKVFRERYCTRSLLVPEEDEVKREKLKKSFRVVPNPSCIYTPHEVFTKIYPVSFDDVDSPYFPEGFSSPFKIEAFVAEYFDTDIDCMIKETMLLIEEKYLKEFAELIGLDLM